MAVFDRPLENVFSWSFSRHNTFRECPRKYWFQYYGSWGGWDHDAPAEARELYALKNLTNLHCLAGDVVHRALERALHAHARGETPEPEEVVAWCKGEMQRSFKESLEETPWRDQPKRATRLFEHHYPTGFGGGGGGSTGGPTKDFLVRIARKIGLSVRNFFTSSSFAMIRETDTDEWLPMETLDSFNFEGTKVYAVPDFAVRHRAEVLILDWKTGRPNPKNRDQVVLYTLFAAAKWDVDPETVQAAPIYLLEGGDFDPKPVTVSDRERVSDLIRSSIVGMKEVLSDADGAAPNTASKEDCKPSPGRVCRSCNFRAVCPHAR